jgi:hypothetical protein
VTKAILELQQRYENEMGWRESGVSLFEDIFGKSSFDEGTSVPVLCLSELIKLGSSLVTYKGKLYRITVEELDTSNLKAKPAPEVKK